MKKAQIHGQVFIYILTLIITGMILLYGYSAIKGISENAKQVELVNFKTKLKSDFETISSDYGSVKTKTYNVPSKVKEICFYEEGDDPFFHTLTKDEDINPLIINSIQDKTENNVFLLIGNAIDQMKLSRIEINKPDYKMRCIKINNNQLKLRLEGLGDGVSVEQA